MGQKNCEGKDRKAGAKLSPFGRGRRINFALKQVSRTSAIAPKASFETSGEWSSLPFVRKRRCAPHPPPKGHACLILMRQHAAFGPPPWWSGSTLRVELRGKTQRRAVLKRRKSFLNFIVIIIIWIEWIKIPSDKYSPISD